MWILQNISETGEDPVTSKFRVREGLLIYDAHQACLSKSGRAITGPVCIRGRNEYHLLTPNEVLHDWCQVVLNLEFVEVFRSFATTAFTLNDLFTEKTH